MRAKRKGFLNITALVLFLVSCSNNVSYATLEYGELLAKAKKEGSIVSLGMPDSWANWGASWNDLKLLYGIQHSDTDMSSGEILTGFVNKQGDIGDVGLEYAKSAKEQKMLIGYKTSYWDEIPSWAKDDEGDYVASFSGTMSLLIKDSVALNAPASFADVAKGSYKVAISDITSSATGQYAVYAAALALGGSSTNIDPGIAFFKNLALQKRLAVGVSTSSFIAGDYGVHFKWDFDSLTARDKAAAQDTPVKLSACIPSDGSVTAGYGTIINKNATSPYVAMLVREYILSDAGQLNVAKGYATPIRSVKLPEELESKRIPRTQYNQTQIDDGNKFTVALSQQIVSAWEKEVKPNL